MDYTSELFHGIYLKLNRYVELSMFTLEEAVYESKIHRFG